MQGCWGGRWRQPGMQRSVRELMGWGYNTRKAEKGTFVHCFNVVWLTSFLCLQSIFLFILQEVLEISPFNMWVYSVNSPVCLPMNEYRPLCHALPFMTMPSVLGVNMSRPMWDCVRTHSRSGLEAIPLHWLRLLFTPSVIWRYYPRQLTVGFFSLRYRSLNDMTSLGDKTIANVSPDFTKAKTFVINIIWLNDFLVAVLLKRISI